MSHIASRSPSSLRARPQLVEPFLKGHEPHVGWPLGFATIDVPHGIVGMWKSIARPTEWIDIDVAPAEFTLRHEMVPVRPLSSRWPKCFFTNLISSVSPSGVGSPL